MIIRSFAEDTLPENETLPHLSTLIQTYLSTMADLGAETWIMHGSLLAWWWNQKVSKLFIDVGSFVHDSG